MLVFLSLIVVPFNSRTQEKINITFKMKLYNSHLIHLLFENKEALV